jgi:hypothetical protein
MLLSFAYLAFSAVLRLLIGVRRELLSQHRWVIRLCGPGEQATE